MSEARKRILKMLAEGKISVEESEELLSALSTDQENERSRHRSGFGVEFGHIADSIQKTMRDAFSRVESPSREVKSRLKEMGEWMQNFANTMANEFAHVGGEPTDGVQVDFKLSGPEGWQNCRLCDIDNRYGNGAIEEGEEFALVVKGSISRAAMEGAQPHQWFAEHALKVDGETLCIGIDRTSPAKYVLDLQLTLPSRFHLKGRSVSSSFKACGAFVLNSLQTVSGDVRLKEMHLRECTIDTVSCDVKIDGGEVELTTNTTSGDICIKDAKVTKLHAVAVSGDVLLTGLDVVEETTVQAATTSGDIEIEKIVGPWSRIEASTRTGDVSIKWKGSLTLTGRHGVVVVSKEAGAMFRAETVSGDIDFN